MRHLLKRILNRKRHLFRLTGDFQITHPALRGVRFDNDWVKITSGRMIVRSGYAWDGCSYKFSLFNRWIIGTPDGPVKEKPHPTIRHFETNSPTKIPITAPASLVHDVLCQFRSEIKISKPQTVEIFRDLLVEANFKWAAAYVIAVDLFGPQNWLVRRK